MDINKKFSNAVDDVVTEVMKSHWKLALEAVHEIAVMIKSSGLSKQVYLLVMENLEIQIKAQGGQMALTNFKHVIRHREHYMSNSVIMLPVKHG